MQPVLSCTSDQDSTLFAAHILLTYHGGFRMVWFPGVCHQESNITSSMMDASGFGHLAEKVNFLTKLNHNPYRGGKWLGVQRMAAEAFVTAVRANEPVATQLMQSSMCNICSDMNWPGPDTDQAWEDAYLHFTCQVLGLFFE